MFEKRKEEVIRSLDSSIAHEKVDPEILETLDLLNSCEEYYTTSSCAGRVALIWMPFLGDKQGSVFLGKWHEGASYENLRKRLEFRDHGVTYLLTQPPILHVAARDLGAALRLKDLALSCGFKDTGIKSISKKIIVEIRSTERVDVPLGEEKILFDEKYLRFLTKYANRALTRSREKLKKFNEILRSSL